MLRDADVKKYAAGALVMLAYTAAVILLAVVAMIWRLI